MNSYSIKVNLVRVTFVLLVMTGWALYEYGHADYILLVSIVVAFGGLFTVSTADLTSGEVMIRKSYFWGLFNIRRNVPYDQILSIRTKKYEIYTHEDVEMFAEDLFSFLALQFLDSKVVWLTTKLCYVDDGENKDIELKITRDNFVSIEREIVNKDDYQTFNRRRGRIARQNL